MSPESHGSASWRDDAAGLLNDWARLLAPHFGPSGSMDLDLRDWPTAQGPSYYNQFGHHALLLLATGEVPGASAEERARYLQLALGNIDYVLSITDADFHTPHFSRGREWGRHIGEWLNYYLLGSLEIMERHGLGTAVQRRRLSDAVLGAVGALQVHWAPKHRETPKEFVGNHDTWHGLLFFRAGRHFGRKDWSDWARDFFTRCVLPFQSPDGYWPEGHGIVVGYSLVTAQAVSLYAEYSGDPAAQASIGRFAGFLKTVSYPDGSSPVVLDVRMRYHRAPFMFLPPGFLRFPAGRDLVRCRLPAARAHLQQAGVRDNGAQAFAFYGSFAERVFSPAVADTAVAVTPPRNLPAAFLASGPWRAGVAWQTVPEHPSRFVLDAQNFVELWHEQAGCLAGTGNSKFMPRFSTVRRTNLGRAYIPDTARRLRSSPEEAEVALGFGEDEIAVGVAVSADRCAISARLLTTRTTADYEFALMLAFRPGDVLASEHGREVIDPTVLIHQQGCPRPQQRLHWRGLHWQLPESAHLDYPIVPHNSYTQDGLPAREDYVARLSFRLTAEPRVIAIVQSAG